jgi:hypothetical protein
MAVQACSLAMVAAADVLDWVSRAELVEYRERVVRLSTDLFAAIAGQLSARAGATRTLIEPHSGVGRTSEEAACSH